MASPACRATTTACPPTAGRGRASGIPTEVRGRPPLPLGRCRWPVPLALRLLPSQASTLAPHTPHTLPTHRPGPPFAPLCRLSHRQRRLAVLEKQPELGRRGRWVRPSCALLLHAPRLCCCLLLLVRRLWCPPCVLIPSHPRRVATHCSTENARRRRWLRRRCLVDPNAFWYSMRLPGGADAASIAINEEGLWVLSTRWEVRKHDRVPAPRPAFPTSCATPFYFSPRQPRL